MPKGTMKSVDSRWVRALSIGLVDSLAVAFPTGEPLEVEAYHRLAVGHEVVDYGATMMRHKSITQTVDLLIAERLSDDRWTPRVAMECLTGDPSTRTAKALDARVAGFKAFNPSMRFGALVGEHGGPGLPASLVKHCPNLDFVTAWTDRLPTEAQWSRLSAIFATEVAASRALHNLIFRAEHHSAGPLRFMHRGLTIE